MPGNNYGYNIRVAFMLLCRYLAVCEPGEILHFTIIDHKIEPMRDCPDGVRRCADQLIRDRHGALLTSCGRDPPQERMGQIELPPRLTVKFKANKKFGDCGFNINVMCNKKSAFGMPGCTTLDDDGPRGEQRRDLSLYNTVRAMSHNYSQALRNIRHGKVGKCHAVLQNDSEHCCVLMLNIIIERIGIGGG